MDGILPSVPLEETRICKLEQRDRREEPLRRARTEQLSRLVQDEDRAQAALVAQAARRQPAGLSEWRELKQPRELVGAVAEFDDLAAGGDGRALARGQMIERRVERDGLGGRARNGHAVAEHAAALVEANQRQLRHAVHLDQRLAERLKCGVLAVRNSQRMGEIGERSRKINKAYEILTELSVSLDHQKGGKISQQLGRLYDYMQGRLLEANIQQADAPLAETLGLLSTLSEAWASVPRAVEPP